jgi:hypothetical protein
VSTTVEQHREAMEFVDKALVARQRGQERQHLSFLKRALELERAAADQVAQDVEFEPTRAVLHRSAASIALGCGELLVAEQLICRGLLGSPPIEIAEELRDLLEQVNFRRHLSLRGVKLDINEFQMSIAGGDVGFGIAPTDAFVDRVQTTEKLLYRTAERKAGRPYRERGPAPRPFKGELELYLSVPRAASLAVSFRMGHKEQMRLPGFDTSVGVVDELLDCLALFNRLDEKSLRQRIPNRAYYINFVGLTRNLAPDGDSVKQVGFTTVRAGSTVEVALTTQQRDVPPQFLGRTAGAAGVKSIEIRGQLLFADALRHKHQIKLVGASEIVHVPEGMMDDIVRPMWGAEVVVTGIKVGNRITLTDIKPAQPDKKSRK